MRKEKKEKIAVIGASIAGCATALMLNQANYNVTIYEQRSNQAMQDRGAGIILSNDLLMRLIEQGIIDSHFPARLLKERIYYSYDAKTDTEREITTMPHAGIATHWAYLYGSLNNYIPQNIYYGSKVTAVEKDKRATLTFDHNEKYEFDIVFFADGYFSLGRKFLFPAVRAEFAKYIAWRGTVARADAESLIKLNEKILYYGYDRGHLLVYGIPDLNSENPQQDLLVNWVFYEKIDNHDLQHPLVHDYRTQDNIAPDAMNKNYMDYLHELASKSLPPFARYLIVETEKPYVQAIYDAHVPEYFVDNMGLIGDASILLRPHAGAGAEKALQDALALQKYIYDTKDLTISLQHWGKDQQKIGNQTYNLARSLGDLLVANPPEWNKLDKPAMDDLWDTAVYTP